jgi:hypothetical protein
MVNDVRELVGTTPHALTGGLAQDDRFFQVQRAQGP